MCETDRPEDQTPAAAVDPTAEETGLWPLPQIFDAVAASSGAPEPELTRLESDQAEETAIPQQVRDETETAQPPESPAGSTADSTPRIIAAISQLGTLVEHRLTGLQTLFEREIRAEATRERIVDRLHAELQEYKQDLLLKVQRPIFIDLIQLHDDIGKMIEAQPADEPDRAAAIRGTLESIRTAIEDTLYRQGVEPFQNEGQDFDPRRQRSVTTVPTDDPERNKTIAGRLRPGFQAGDKLIRPEIVSVHILKK
jgi:molecular chaperone GrpE